MYKDKTMLEYKNNITKGKQSINFKPYKKNKVKVGR
jgi:hypothetical protein